MKVLFILSDGTEKEGYIPLSMTIGLVQEIVSTHQYGVVAIEILDRRYHPSQG